MAGPLRPSEKSGGPLIYPPPLFDEMKRIPQSSPAMRLFGFLAVLISSGLAALAQTNAPEPRKLSLEDCIAIALRHNLDVQIKRYNPEISRFALLGAYGAYDPSLSISGEHDFNSTPGGLDPQGRPFGFTEKDADNFRAGFQGLLP